jgi:hypothetical protein
MPIKRGLYRIVLPSMALTITIALGGINPAVAQEESKGMRPEEAGLKTDPKREKRKKPTTVTPRRPFTPGPPTAGTEFAQVGITVWRVEAEKGKGVEQAGSEQTQVRLDTNAAYANGDQIRLTIISPTGGYLYVVDQEQYSDGSHGPAYLVFPTLTTRKGNNLIGAWEPVQVPAYPSSWRFKPRTLAEGEVRKRQTAEVFTVIISPKPLIGISRISDQQLKLDKGEFERWQAQWKTPVRQFDMENMVGQSVKTGSKGVDQVGKEAISEEELDAQTTYQVAIKPGTPIMVTLPLRFKAETPVQAPN